MTIENYVNKPIFNIKNLIELLKMAQDPIKLLENYIGTDWKDIISEIKSPDPNLNGYYRYLVERNLEFEIYLIVWFPNAYSPIHNHPEQGCYVKILDGTLDEELYKNIGNNQAQLIQQKTLQTNDINYKIGSTILHRIKNPSNNIVVSIHIYRPPNFKSRFFNI
jgi:predicted metal-dependent enzyme (double-stranded beta helix superfamily)